MYLYSETSKVFIERVREEIRSLFFLEIEPILPLKFNRSRILYKNFQFPLSIVVFEDQTRLGYFDYRYYEIGISKKLMFLAFDEVLRNVIRHELAHYLAYLLYGADLGHGEKFNQLCRDLNWNDNVSKAYSNLEIENEKVTHVSHKNTDLMIKIKKLLALSSSDNIHESEMATTKANQLLLEYNLSLINLNNYEENEVFVARVLESSKKTSKHMAIYEILKTFYVSPVFNHGKKSVYLEIVGSFSNVEIAQYVAIFLDSELDRLWKKTQIDNPHLKGIVAKNSFFRGVARGYVEKINSINHALQTENKQSLMIIKNSLAQNLQTVYKRLGSSYSKDLKEHSEASHKGQSAGKNLSIKPGLKNNQKTTFLLGS
jgi:hypothetical protein